MNLYFFFYFFYVILLSHKSTRSEKVHNVEKKGCLFESIKIYVF